MKFWKKDSYRKESEIQKDEWKPEPSFPPATINIKGVTYDMIPV